MRAPRGTFEVWGANHNAYNTEWLESDSLGCTGVAPLFPQAGRSEKQQQTALVPVVRFFTALVGRQATPALADLFDPTFDLPSTLTKVTRVQRGYLPAAPGDAVKLLETFSKTTPESDAGVPYRPVGLSVANERDEDHAQMPRIARVTWSGGVATRQFDIRFTKKAGLDLSGYRTLSLRTAIGCTPSTCDKPLNPNGEMEFKLRLIGASGQLSTPLSTKGRIALTRPVGMEFLQHRMLATVSFDLSAFGLPLQSVAGVRLVFDSRAEGDVDIGTIVATTRPVKPFTGGPVVTVASAGRASAIAAARAAREPGNTVRVLPPNATPTLGKMAAGLRLELASPRRFPFTDALPVLTIGDVRIRDVAIGADGRTAIARLTAAEAAALKAASDVSLTIGGAPVWAFGPLPAR